MPGEDGNEAKGEESGERITAAAWVSGIVELSETFQQGTGHDRLLDSGADRIPS
jgi:hypothetical protein